MTPLPSLGRIVLVRSPKFLVEFPAIVVRTYTGVSEEHCDVQVFTDEDCGTVFLAAIGPQAESSKQYGWRWPPRVEPSVPIGIGGVAALAAPTAQAPALAPQESARSV